MMKTDPKRFPDAPTLSARKARGSAAASEFADKFNSAATPTSSKGAGDTAPASNTLMIAQILADSIMRTIDQATAPPLKQLDAVEVLNLLAADLQAKIEARTDALKNQFWLDRSNKLRGCS